MSIGDTDFGVQVSIGVVGRVVAALVAFLGSIVLARVLGPDGYGTFYLLMAVVAFLDNPITGWAKACRKRLTEEDFPSGETIGSMFVSIVLTSAAVFLLSWLLSPFVAEFTGYEYGWLLLAALFVGMVAYRTSIEVLKSTERFGMSTWLEASRDTSRVIAQVALVTAGLGVAGMVGGMVLANLLLAPVVFYLLGTRPRLPTLATVRRIWDYARFSIPGGIVGTAQSRMDLILLGFLVGPGITGNYEVAFKLTMPAMFVAGVAQNGLMGRISNLRSRDKDVSTDVQNNLAHASILGVPIFFGALTMAGPIIVTIYSNQYEAAGPFLAGLALFRLLRTQKSILLSTINGFDRPDLNLRISTAVFVFNLALGLGLLYLIGPIGVVIATVLSEFLGYGVRGYMVKSLVPSVRLVPRPLVEQVASGVIMAAVILAARAALPLADWPVVVFVVGLGGVTYFAALTGISHPFRATVVAVARDMGLPGVGD